MKAPSSLTPLASLTSPTNHSRTVSWSHIEFKDSGKLVVHAQVLIVERMRMAAEVTKFAEEFCPSVQWLEVES